MLIEVMRLEESSLNGVAECQWIELDERQRDVSVALVIDAQEVMK